MGGASSEKYQVGDSSRIDGGKQRLVEDQEPKGRLCRYRTRWDATRGIMQRAVARGLARHGTLTLTDAGVDEKSFQRRHEYVTVVSDLTTRRVLSVADDRKRESLEGFWALGLTAAQRTQIRAIAAAHAVPSRRALRPCFAPEG